MRDDFPKSVKRVLAARDGRYLVRHRTVPYPTKVSKIEQYHFEPEPKMGKCYNKTFTAP